MNYSTEYISAIVVILAAILPRFGVQVGSEELTSWIMAVITLIGGAIIMYKRFKRGDINVLGAKKY